MAQSEINGDGVTVQMLLRMLQEQSEQNRQIMEQMRHDAEAAREDARAREAELLARFGRQESRNPRFEGHTTEQRPVVNYKDAPKLCASATLSDFSRWQQRWGDFYECQHLGRQGNATQLASLR